ncbi:hypothetical protein GCM10017687_41680 [Streptomyces echinatus]
MGVCQCGVNRGQGSLPKGEGGARAGEEHGGGCVTHGAGTPWGVPDSNRPPPRADGSRENFPPPREPILLWSSTGSQKPHQSLREEEFPVNLRTT